MTTDDLPREQLARAAEITLDELHDMLRALGFHDSPDASILARYFGDPEGALRCRVSVVLGITEALLIVRGPTGGDALHGPTTPVALWNTRYEHDATAQGLTLRDTDDVLEVVGALVRASR